MTGGAISDETERFLDAIGDRVIPKPIDRHALRAAVEQVRAARDVFPVLLCGPGEEGLAQAVGAALVAREELAVEPARRVSPKPWYAIARTRSDGCVKCCRQTDAPNLGRR